MSRPRNRRRAISEPADMINQPGHKTSEGYQLTPDTPKDLQKFLENQLKVGLWQTYRKTCNKAHPQIIPQFVKIPSF